MADDVVEQLELLEGHLQSAYRAKRFDTFRQLLDERFTLLKRARGKPGAREVFALAARQTEEWSGVLGRRMAELRAKGVRQRSAGSMGPGRAGRVVNHSA